MSLNQKLSIEDISVQDKQVLVRVDYNVPLENGKITDAIRITASLPTLRYLLDSGAKKLILISHLGRPDGEKKNSLSLMPVAIELQNIMGESVRFVSDCVGESVISECKNAPERIVLLENLRFHVEEEGKCKRKDGTCVTSTLEEQEKFCSNLSQLGEVYVNDAFGTVHRAHSSISGITIEPRVAGLLVKKELLFFAKALEGPEKLHTLILGGAKITDKIQLIEHMLPRVENVIIGGGMAFTFLRILKGMNIGKSLFDQKGSEIIKEIIEHADKYNVKIHLPIDFVEGSNFSEMSDHQIVEDAIDPDWMGMDIGPKSCRKFTEIIDSADPGRVILWNGPMGVFEWANFAHGTNSVLNAIVKSTEKGCVTIVGGGDSAAAVSKWNCEKRVSHVSTGGGASLELLEGKKLPGIEHLTNKAVSTKGTKRFHGAFEGGFSAGYFNSVGSKEGWKPSEFISSRDKRYKKDESEANNSSGIERYMDEDDLADHNYKELIFIGSNEFDKYKGYSFKMENDPLDYISRYLKTSKFDANIKVSKKKINEAFSGGGAWDEDDENPEIYEGGPELHKIADAVESVDHFVEEALCLNFSVFFTITQHCIYPRPNLPDDYIPKKLQIDSNIDFDSETNFSTNSQSIPDLGLNDIEDVDEKTASAALKGFMPFSEDPEKQARYTRYLRYCSGKTDISKSSLYVDEKEREEFVMSAQIFKPPSSIISARFESSSTPLQPQIILKAGLFRPDPSKKSSLSSNDVLPTKNRIEVPSSNVSASRRISYVWVPNSLLCKRFNIAPPDTGVITSTEAKKIKPILADESMEQIVNTLLKDSKSKSIDFETPHVKHKEYSVPTIPADDLFNEIFGTSSSDPQIKSKKVKAIDYFDD